MIPIFNRGEPVFAGSTRATFVRMDGDSRAIIMVGYDTRVVDAVTLRRVEQ